MEIQGSAENAGGGFDRQTTQTMLDLAVAGCEHLMAIQRECAKRAQGVSDGDAVILYDRSLTLAGSWSDIRRTPKYRDIMPTGW